MRNGPISFMPFKSAGAFISDDLGHRLMRMVGFRNVAIHEYRDLNLEIVQSIIEHRLADFSDFAELVVSTDGFRRDT